MRLRWTNPSWVSWLYLLCIHFPKMHWTLWIWADTRDDNFVSERDSLEPPSDTQQLNGWSWNVAKNEKTPLRNGARQPPELTLCENEEWLHCWCPVIGELVLPSRIRIQEDLDTEKVDKVVRSCQRRVIGGDYSLPLNLHKSHCLYYKF